MATTRQQHAQALFRQHDGFAVQIMGLQSPHASPRDGTGLLDRSQGDLESESAYGRERSLFPAGSSTGDCVCVQCGREQRREEKGEWGWEMQLHGPRPSWE